MKKGFFSTLSICIFRFLPILMAACLLQGCASFLDLSERVDDPAEFDRGYAKDDLNDVEEDSHTETMAAPRRAPASDTSEELSYEQRRIKRAIETRDVILGMSRHEVAESWGSPTQREVAGRGTGGHERWTYGSRYSLSGTRTVIFENGKVAGWSH